MVSFGKRPHLGEVTKGFTAYTKYCIHYLSNSNQYHQSSHKHASPTPSVSQVLDASHTPPHSRIYLLINAATFVNRQSVCTHQHNGEAKLARSGFNGYCGLCRSRLPVSPSPSHLLCSLPSCVLSFGLVKQFKAFLRDDWLFHERLKYKKDEVCKRLTHECRYDSDPITATPDIQPCDPD